MTKNFPATRAAALTAWQEFLPQLGLYAQRRNLVTPGHPHVSRLSPAIRTRLVREEELVEQTLARFSLPEVEKFIQEIYWRSYWKGWLEQRPDVWKNYRQRLPRLRDSFPAATALERGASGVAVMDRFARELVETGYLHNHARMWFASFWIHARRLPWELGADFFYRHLLDADPASNTLSWRWVAGLQTPGKTYLVRRSNLEKYLIPDGPADTRGLDALNDGAIQPCPVLETADLSVQPPDLPKLHPEELPFDQIPEPYGLWLHGEDLSVENSPLARLHPAALVGFILAPLLENYALSPARKNYLATALLDGVTRAARHFGLTAEVRKITDLATEMVTWAVAKKLKSIVALRPFIGPLADELPKLHETLVAQNIRLILVRRPEDARLIPWAERGYFPFWEKVRRRLKTKT